jgi:hypothetical protein
MLLLVASGWVEITLIAVALQQKVLHGLARVDSLCGALNAKISHGEDRKTLRG